MNYERIIQWVSGPFSASVGVLATKAVSHLSFLGTVGLGKSAAAHAITTSTVFLVTSGITYAGHHKWLTNAAKWWEHSGLTLPAGLSDSAPPDTTGTTVTPDNAAKLRQQLEAAGLTPEA